MATSRVIVLGLVLILAACRQAPDPADKGAPGPPAGGQAAAKPVTGPVLETMDAAPYTYVRVKGPEGDIWAAAPQFPVKVGDRVVVPIEMAMKGFHSQALNRDFPLLYFATSIRREGETAAPAAGLPTVMSAHGSPSSSPSPAAPATPETIAPMPAPEGGTTIADVWANRKTLAGKAVTVRGKVVKFNSQILGHNWMHLQDGSGKRADGSNDLTVTVGEDVSAGVGDTITVTGTLTLNKDFGAGYSYPLILENARPLGRPR